jgi:hypothetical protein
MIIKIKDSLGKVSQKHKKLTEFKRIRLMGLESSGKIFIII